MKEFTNIVQVAEFIQTSSQNVTCVKVRELVSQQLNIKFYEWKQFFGENSYQNIQSSLKVFEKCHIFNFSPNNKREMQFGVDMESDYKLTKIFTD